MVQLFHRIPVDMVGDMLFPLNELKVKHPVVYERQVKKYKGREELLGDTIPVLNCLWNDVLHFTPVHPLQIKQAMAALGKAMPASDYLVVDPYQLEPSKTVVYLYKHPERQNKFKPGNFIAFDPAGLGQYCNLPQATKDYYAQQLKAGQSPLLFFRVPHVLYKGSIALKGRKVITV